jgi:predicted nuclease with TOPRIM domain
MARQESDREDLLREAVGLVRRVELRIGGEVETVTAGFRRNGALSVYFGADPVWQFNTAGEVRRGYVAGKLLKADGGRLVEMIRERTDDVTQLVSRELSEDESQTVLSAAAQRIDHLRAALGEGRYDIVGQVPEGGNIVGELYATLKTLPKALVVAASPRVGD